MDEEKGVRTGEIVQYLRQREVIPYLEHPGTTEVHLHFHQAPPTPVDNRPVDQNPKQSALDKYTPYFILGLFGCIILAIVSVVMIMLAQTLMVIAASTIALVIAVGFVGRSLTQDKVKRDTMELMKEKTTT